MRESAARKPQETICRRGGYDELRTIKGIEFTEREIDVMVCVLSGIAKKKAIAAFLTTPFRTISTRTVETHLHNIIRKLGCVSQSGVIDFIERANARSLVRIHYEYLQAQIDFEKKLATLRSRIFPKPLCVIYECNQKNDFIRTLLNHLEMVGIKTTLKEADDITIRPSSQAPVHHLYVISKELIDQFAQNKAELSEQKNLTFLLVDNTISYIPEGFLQAGIIRDQENYYGLFFELLQRMTLDPEVGKMIAEFKKAAVLPPEHLINHSLQQLSSYLFTLGSVLKKGRYWIIPLITVSASFLYLLDWGSQGNKTDKPGEIAVNATNLTPLESTLLQRPHLMQQLATKLKGTQGVQITALVGVGGAGKTTLARQYAQQQKAGFVWEVNAETLLSLTHSFEKMAFALCHTEDDHKFLRSLQSIQNASEREEKILTFVKGKLTICPRWFLIYDNVEKVAAIRPYLPLEAHTWGNGKVIITTRDSHIRQDHYITNKVSVGALTSQEKLMIFMNITHYGGEKAFVKVKLKGAKNFLRKIEPFPLDVSLAAYYLKATNISYNQYLSHLTSYNQSFILLQERVLKDASDYTLTRYGIICLSIDKLLCAQKDFGALMLLISTLDSQNIPRGLLENLKDKVMVDNFIYHLKKYSLITNDEGGTISLHRNMQAIGLQYLIQRLGLQRDSPLIQQIATAVKKYMHTLTRDGSYPKLKDALPHFEIFLSHRDLLPEEIKADLGIELGYIYALLDRYQASRQLLEKILEHLQRERYPMTTAKALIHLGICYEDLGKYKEAEVLFERGIATLQKYPHHPTDMVKALLHLGILYRDLGEYQRSKELLTKLNTVYGDYCSQNEPYLFAAILGYLGTVCTELGNYENARHLIEKTILVYGKRPDWDVHRHLFLESLGIVYAAMGETEKARDLMEQGISFLDQQFAEDCGYTSIRLGDVYKNLGYHEKAKKILEKNIRVLKKYFPERHSSMGRALAYLGDVHRCTGQLKIALQYLQEALILHEKQYSPGHLETARVLKMIGQVYLAMGEVESAQAYLDKSLKIFQKSGHPEIYTIFEVMAEFSLKKLADNRKNAQQSQVFKEQALDYLVQAKQIVTTHFPENSPHLTRIQTKMETLT